MNYAQATMNRDEDLKLLLRQWEATDIERRRLRMLTLPRGGHTMPCRNKPGGISAKPQGANE